MPKEEAGQASASPEELAVLAARPTYIEVYWLVRPPTAAEVEGGTAKDADDWLPIERNAEPIRKTLRVAPMTYKVGGQVAAQLRDIVSSLGLQIRKEDIPNIIADHNKEVLAMASLATREPEASLGHLDMGQFSKVAFTVFKVNKDFFDQCVGPMVESLGALLGVGPTTSISSTSTDTTQ